MPEQKYANITRKETEDQWTDGKEDAAQIIESLIESGDWPISLPELADQTQWSRSHYRNTLRDGFKPVEEDNRLDTLSTNRSIDIPENVENPSEYLRGVAKGYALCRQE